MIARHPTFHQVESAYQGFYLALFRYLDDGGEAVDEDFACGLDQDLCDVWDRFEARCVPCDECDCWPCRCEESP